MVTLLRALFTRPFYHLLVAGPSVPCSRLMFMLSAFYGYLLSLAIFNTAAIWLNHYLITTGFPFTSFGKHVPYCKWSLLSERDTPAYEAAVTSYINLHASTLSLFSYSIRAVACVAALFMVWRLFMLVLQRCNGTFIPPLAASLATAICVLASFSFGAVVNTHAALFVALWVFILLVIPGTKPLQQAPAWLQAWVLSPLWHAFSLSFTTAISGRVFAVGVVAACLLPVVIRTVFERLAYFQLLAESSRPYGHVDNFICNMAALATPAWGDSYYKATIFAKVFHITPSFTFGSFVLLDILLVLLIAIWVFSLTAQRMRALVSSYAVAWALVIWALVIVASGLGGLFIHPQADVAVLALAAILLTVLPSRHQP